MAEGITGWRLHVGVIFPTPVPPRAVLEFYEAVPEGVDMTTVSLTIQQLSDDDMDEAIKGMERAAKQLASFDVDLIYQSGVPPVVRRDRVSATSSPTVCRRPRACPRSPTCRA
jgi:maleate cis-trans isomerase